MPAALTAALAGTRLVVFDVDGTLTDGAVTYGDRTELQRFCVRDGQGLVFLQRIGLQVAWISGRGCAATERRAAELGVAELCLRQGPKGPVLEALQRRLGLSPAVTVAMGDDLPDLALFARAAVGVCPADAVPEVRAAAHWVCGAPGGHGAVRELCELLLRAQGRWEGLLAEAAR